MLRPDRLALACAVAHFYHLALPLLTPQFSLFPSPPHQSFSVSLADDGGGIYRHVWLTTVANTGAYLGPEGVYVPSNVSGAITWVAGQPTGTGLVTPTAEVWSNASTPTPFTIAFDIYDAAGQLVGSASGQGTAAPNAVTVAAPAQPVVTLPGATLWHLVQPPLKPYLYRLVTTLSLAGAPVQAKNTTFGIRRTRWDAATGFYLNDEATKILGTANHQDYAGMGVAFPDHLQWNRVAKLKEIGVNGWRTAHNPPTPALLDAMDELGMVCWDENHRNGQFDQVPLLVRRDRKSVPPFAAACSPFFRAHAAPLLSLHCAHAPTTPHTHACRAATPAWSSGRSVMKSFATQITRLRRPGI